MKKGSITVKSVTKKRANTEEKNSHASLFDMSVINDFGKQIPMRSKIVHEINLSFKEDLKYLSFNKGR